MPGRQVPTRAVLWALAQAQSFLGVAGSLTLTSQTPGPEQQLWSGANRVHSTVCTSPHLILLWKHIRQLSSASLKGEGLWGSAKLLETCPRSRRDRPWENQACSSVWRALCIRLSPPWAPAGASAVQRFSAGLWLRPLAPLLLPLPPPPTISAGFSASSALYRQEGSTSP